MADTQQQQPPNTTTSTPNPPTPPVIHNAALAGAILCPLVMLLPPRRLDWRFAILSGTFSMSTSQLTYDYTGKSIYDRVGSRFQKMFSPDMPEAAKEAQRRLREERMRREGLSETEMRRIEAGKRNALQKLWYGGESDEEWDRKRAEEHQRALDEGKGISGIIMGQISEVMPGGGSGKKEDESKGDEKKK